MHRLRDWLLPVVAWLALAAGVTARPALPKPDAGAILQIIGGGTTDALAGSLRGYLVRAMPEPLYETAPRWGETRPGADGLKWRGLRPEVQYRPRNHGKWRRLRVHAVNPADTLIFDIRNLDHPEPGRLLFTVFLSFDARVDYEQENWRKGIRFYHGSARARFRVKATLDCEAIFRLEDGSLLLLPDAVFRLRVVRADVGYDNFEAEHLAGLGGELAELLGDAVRGGLRRWHPDLERNLLTRLNSAIEQSADTKEVRLSVSKLLHKQGWSH
jgi:hypothetical protein